MSGGGKKSAPEIPSEKTHLAEPISYYRSRTGKYPSNSTVWWAFRRPIELGTKEPPKTYLEVFDPSLRHQVTTGNSPAPKGHYILKAFRQDRSAVSGVGGMSVDDAGAFRPSCVAFYAGRVFYSGVNTVGFNTKVYFSQILEKASDAQRCYQSLDPTAEDLRDLLASDGGVVNIPEMSEVYYLHAMGQSLYVFARNGVWSISGSGGIGFRANDFSVSKVSGIPSISSMSFVSVEGAPVWWNQTGVYTIAMDGNGQSAVRSLTEDTIKQFFDTIPTENKTYVKGAYDPLLKRAQWVYRSDPIVDIADRWKYDTILNLDTSTGAWYVFTPAPADRVELLGIFDVEGHKTSQEFKQAVVGADDVVVGDDTVTVLTSTQVPIQSAFKYIINVKSDTIDVPAPPADEE